MRSPKEEHDTKSRRNDNTTARVCLSICLGKSWKRLMPSATNHYRGSLTSIFFFFMTGIIGLRIWRSCICLENAPANSICLGSLRTLMRNVTKAAFVAGDSSTLKTNVTKHYHGRDQSSTFVKYMAGRGNGIGLSEQGAGSFVCQKKTTTAHTSFLIKMFVTIGVLLFLLFVLLIFFDFFYIIQLTSS